MKCPNCSGEMINHQFIGRFDQKIKLKKCQICHGFWFKNFALFDLPEETCFEIDKTSHGEANYHKKIYCPKCEEPLVNFTNYNIPLNLHFKVCKKCNGIWSFAGKVKDFKLCQLNLKKESGKISSQIKIVLTMSFSFLFGLISYFNYFLNKGLFTYSAASSTDLLEKTNNVLAIEGIVFLLFVGVVLVIWGRYRKIGWVLNFCALFIIIFYFMLHILRYYPYVKS